MSFTPTAYADRLLTIWCAVVWWCGLLCAAQSRLIQLDRSRFDSTDSTDTDSTSHRYGPSQIKSMHRYIRNNACSTIRHTRISLSLCAHFMPSMPSAPLSCASVCPFLPFLALPSPSTPPHQPFPSHPSGLTVRRDVVSRHAATSANPHTESYDLPQPIPRVSLRSVAHQPEKIHKIQISLK